MLTVEHVRVSRRKQGIVVVPRCGLTEGVAAALLDELLAVAREHHGRTRGELQAALDDVVVPGCDARPRDAFVAQRAARKLVLDRCSFAARDDLDPPALRAAVFAAAAAARAAAAATERAPFDRAAVLADVGAATGVDATTLEAALWADLEDAHLVDAAPLAGMNGTGLLSTWEQAELQAILLRARRVVVDVDAPAAQLRRLLSALKLHQLLFAVEPTPALAAHGELGVRLVVEGPMALFSSSTRYGLKLALLLPHVLSCRRYRLAADVALSKGRAPTPFVLAGRGVDDGGVIDDLPPLVRTLIDELAPLLRDALPGFVVKPAVDVIAVAGGGAFVPDVVVEHADGARAFVEVLGFWSRDAVWRRVEWVEQGLLPAPTVVCVSERLRVSEQALPDDPGGALVVFKGALSARKVAAALVARLT
jgi:predicted nuclease of restriction endonuclease-like RecB superfamily